MNSIKTLIEKHKENIRFSSYMALGGTIIAVPILIWWLEVEFHLLLIPGVFLFSFFSYFASYNWSEHEEQKKKNDN